MSIPASAIVQVIPSVVGTGGTSLVLNGVIVDQSTLIPTNSYLSFSSATAVGKYFGVGSTQYAIASIYFNGYTNGTQLPQALYFAPYNVAARAAWVLGSSLAGVALTTIQAISGTLIVTVDGVVKTASSLNLSAASSFTNAATLITTALGSGCTCTWSSTLSAFQITSSTTGTTSTITYATGTTANALGLSVVAGATLSQGDAIDTPTTAMSKLVAQTTNWGSFTTSFEPITADKLSFASWNNSQQKDYLYVAWDSDANAVNANATTTFGYQLTNTYSYEGCLAIGGDPAQATILGISLASLNLNVAAFVLGMIASIDFTRTNARITGAFKSQSGLLATVANQTSATNLISNGYNFYGSYATSNDTFTFLYPAQISGTWKWMDPYVNQVYMNNQFQLDLMTLLNNVGSVPYNDAGYELVKASLSDTINSMVSFGAIRTGVVLSALQKAQVNAAAGVKIDPTLNSQGWYLQVLDPGAAVRGTRGTPVVNFWYTDGGAIQKITMASIDIM